MVGVAINDRKRGIAGAFAVCYEGILQRQNGNVRKAGGRGVAYGGRGLSGRGRTIGNAISLVHTYGANDSEYFFVYRHFVGCLLDFFPLSVVCNQKENTGEKA